MREDEDERETPLFFPVGHENGPPSPRVFFKLHGPDADHPEGERRNITIFLTLCDKEDATHVPVATYKTMGDAVADMEEVNRVLSGKDEILIGR